MEEKVKKIVHSHWRYTPRRNFMRIVTPNGEFCDIPTDFVKDMVVGKLKSSLKRYNTIYQAERQARLDGKYNAVDFYRGVRNKYDAQVLKWVKMWDNLMSEYEKLDPKVVKALHSIEDVLKWYGKEVKMHKTQCIAHNDSHPSMHVYKDSVHCFACGYHGDIIDIVMRMEGVDFNTAMRRLAGLT